MQENPDNLGKAQEPRRVGGAARSHSDAAHTISRYVSDEVIGWLNELLPDAGPIGAYCMGIGHAACLQAGIEPKRYFLAALRKSWSIEAAAAFIDDWIEAEQKALPSVRHPESSGATTEATPPHQVNRKKALP